MSVYYKIGTVAKEFGLSVGTLHHYEREGLLTPEYTDPETGYRYYSDRQFEVLNTIRYLRTLDMPLDRISEFLKNRNMETILSMLEEQKKEVEKRQKELDVIKKKIEHRTEFLLDARNTEYDICFLKNVEPHRIVRVQEELRPKEYFDLEQQIRAMDRGQPLTAISWGKVGLQMAQEQLLKEDYRTYSSVFLLLDEEDLYIGKCEEVPEATCAAVRFCGSHADAEPYYRKLTGWIAEKGLTIAGPSDEITLIDNGITSDQSRFVTEIRIPVR